MTLQSALRIVGDPSQVWKSAAKHSRRAEDVRVQSGYIRYSLKRIDCLADPLIPHTPRSYEFYEQRTMKSWFNFKRKRDPVAEHFARLEAREEGDWLYMFVHIFVTVAVIAACMKLGIYTLEEQGLCPVKNQGD